MLCWLHCEGHDITDFSKENNNDEMVFVTLKEDGSVLLNNDVDL